MSNFVIAAGHTASGNIGCGVIANLDESNCTREISQLVAKELKYKVVSMKKILIGILLISSVFSIEANAAQYEWKKVSDYSIDYWICYKDNVKVHGWNNINGNWYYFYDRNGHMDYNTFVDGYYLNSDGAWTNDIPYVIQRIINVVPDSEWIYTAGNIDCGGIGMFPNKNLKNECSLGWNAPDVNGTIVSINENDFFVADDGTVYKAPHQAGETLLDLCQYSRQKKSKFLCYISC